MTWTASESSGDGKPPVTVGPDRVEAAAAVVVAALRPGVDTDWSVPAGPHPAAAGWGQPPPLGERTEIPLEFGRDAATGEWRAIRWAT